MRTVSGSRASTRCPIERTRQIPTPSSVPSASVAALPARVVRGVFNVDHTCEFGLISDFGSLFTVPATLYVTPPSSTPRAELYKSLIPDLGYADFEIIVTAAGQINLALWRVDNGGAVAFAVRGFYDERLQ